MIGGRECLTVGQKRCTTYLKIGIGRIGLTYRLACLLYQALVIGLHLIGAIIDLYREGYLFFAHMAKVEREFENPASNGQYNFFKMTC